MIIQLIINIDDFWFFREQRVTLLLIFALIVSSVKLSFLLKYIPMPVLYRVFLYMAVASLNGIQFFDRILLFFMPKKYQPDVPYLRKFSWLSILMTFIFFWCFQGATCNAYFDFCSNRRLRQVVFCPQIHPHACVVRSLFVHGRGILERNSIFWPDFALLYAQEISTRRPLFAQGWTLAGPFVHRGPNGLPCRIVDHQGRQTDFDSIPGKIDFKELRNWKYLKSKNMYNFSCMFINPKS